MSGSSPDADGSQPGSSGSTAPLPLTSVRERWLLAVLGALVVARSIHLGVASFLRAETFQSYWPLDVANVNQAIWNTAHGRLLYSTILYQGPRDHFDPILACFAPLYWLSDSPLGVFQLYSLVIGSGALAVYLLARRCLPGNLLPLLLAAHYLVLPPLVELTVFRLKGDVIAVPLLLFAFHSYREQRFRPFVAFATLALLCKESVAVVMIAWGLSALVERRPRRWVLTPVIAGAAVLVFTLLIYHPFIQGHAYKHLAGLPEAPGVSSLLAPSGWVFLARRLVPYYAASALLSPATLVPGLPLLVAALVWPTQLQHEMWLHVLAPAYPFVIAAGVIGTGRLLTLTSRCKLNRALVAVLVLASIALMFGRNLPLYRLPRASAEDRAVRGLIATIPGSSSVSAPPIALPALSTRTVLHSLAVKGWRATGIDVLAVDYVLVDTRGLVWSRLVTPPGPPRKVEAEYLKVVELVRSHPSFELVGSSHGWELYRRKG